MDLKKVFCISTLFFTTSLAQAYTPSFYLQHNLVSDGFVQADHVDSNLVNSWGIGFNVTSKAVVINNGTGTFTAYDGEGVALPLIITIPPAPSVGGIGTPTGTVSNNTNGWVVSKNGISWPSAFIFVTEDGTISAWAPRVDKTNALLMVDNSASGAVYKGVTRGANGAKTLLYVTNFHAGTVEVYDWKFNRYDVPGGFNDPDLPDGYAPFGIQNINGDIYVTYAKQDEAKHDNVNGAGLGIVNAFDANGYLIKRIASHFRLNAPWGMALAPANFGKFSNHLLVANFGDGTINAYDLVRNKFKGKLLAGPHNPISINGLWGIAFENGFNNQFVNNLFFAAGVNDEKHGLYGKITPV